MDTAALKNMSVRTDMTSTVNCHTTAKRITDIFTKYTVCDMYIAAALSLTIDGRT